MLVGEDADEGDEDDAEREEREMVSVLAGRRVSNDNRDEPQPEIDPGEGQEGSVDLDAAGGWVGLVIRAEGRERKGGSASSVDATSSTETRER